MYEIKLLKAVEKIPIFSLADAAKITKSRGYAKKLLARLVEQGIIRKVIRDVYTVHDDPMLTAPYIYPPSYISCLSALQYHGLVTQIPNAIFLMTRKRSKKIKDKIPLLYYRTKDYYGFQMIKYEDILIPVAEPEKAFIDSIGIHPLHVIEESLEELDPKKLMDYAEKTGETKRIGYLLEKNNIKAKISKKFSYEYIYLDPLATKKGRRSRKWRLIVNY